MKISLQMDQQASSDSPEARARVLEHDILAAKQGDWNAKNQLVRMFMPLLTSLAQKRTSDTAKINLLIDAGKKGIFLAAKKYKKDIGAENFQIFALDFVDKAMDQASSGKGGFFARLFGKS